MKMIAACIGLAIAVLTSPASAQSVEEAATFVLTGVEPDAKIDIGEGEASWRRVRGGPAIFEAEGLKDGERVVLTMSAKRVDECLFEIKAVADVGDRKSVDTLQIKADFSRLDDVGVADGEIVFTGEGLCVTDKVDQNCHRDVSGIAKTIDPANLKAAYTRFRKTVCKR